MASQAQILLAWDEYGDVSTAMMLPCQVTTRTPSQDRCCGSAAPMSADYWRPFIPSSSNSSIWIPSEAGLLPAKSEAAATAMVVVAAMTISNRSSGLARTVTRKPCFKGYG